MGDNGLLIYQVFSCCGLISTKLSQIPETSTCCRQICLSVKYQKKSYRKTSTISRTLIGNKIVDNSDVIGASPVGAAPTTSSFST